ncbi:MAG TPA: bifunctional 4-hydroxy-2-oxoglutarate aldolase/2-dehydro-3-deoxy-phosphogluconate aldolase [Spongiibacteraceae bacterium]|nr:bifunctional 4-hydroxy-2-oxoglutarate aldolase/2-dehydro-3-deoxy-phosphogluconate aldolase [Spongiibacteraceae bacterium]
MSSFVDTLARLKIIPVVVIERAAEIIPLGQVLADNGLPVAEITFRTEAAAEAIALLRKAQPQMLIGAGTVLNREQMAAAQGAGASFMVSPGLNPNNVRNAQGMGLPIIPGVNNPSDIECALALGLSALKFFPAEASGGLKMLKALMGPFNQVSFMPTGGIGLHNIVDYLSLPGVIACGGSWMVETDLVRAGNWTEIGKRVREAVALVR